MVWLEVENGGMTAIMIDGYLPEFTYLSTLDLRKLRQEGNLLPVGYWSQRLPKYIRDFHIRSTIPSENQQLKLYCALIHDLRLAYCKRVEGHHKTICLGLSTGSNNYSLERELLFYKRRFSEYSHSLVREYEADRRCQRRPYLQVLILGKGCGAEKECCSNWINLLDFGIKQRENYQNLGGFLEAWKGLIRARYLPAYRDQLEERHPH